VAVPILAAALAVAGCASSQRQPSQPAPTPAEVYRSLLGRNPGLNSVRAVVEARISFGGRDVSLPGVLMLDAFGGFRLDLLDPLDRPLAILFVENGRIVQYRPSLRLAASLGVFPADCRGVDPADWVAAITASSSGPVAGEQLADHWLLGGERSFQRSRGSAAHQSVRYRGAGDMARPRLISWYCGEDTVLQLRLSEWVQNAAWQLPSLVEIDYLKVGLTVRIELREIEGNPPPTSQPLLPRLGADIGWISWNLPQ